MTVTSRPSVHGSYIDLQKNELRNATLQNLGTDIATPVDGLIFYRTDTDRIRLRANGVWVDIATTADAGSGIPGTTFDAKGDLLLGTGADAYARQAVGANGTILVANSTPATGVEWRALTEGDLTLSATDVLVGRDTAAGGAAEEITVTGGIVFTGAGGIQTTAFTGDVTKTLGGTVLTIANDAVTYAKMQNVSATDRLLGRDTAGAGDVEELTVGGGIEFTGTGIQTSALTGDVTKAAGSTVTAIGTGVIVDADVNASAAIAATKLAFTPAQNIAATNVQAAIEEVVTDMTALIGSTIQGFDWKEPARVATTANITLSAAQTIDGVALAVGDRVLVKNQTTTSENGIYLVAAGAWTRTVDFDVDAETVNATIFIEAGTVSQGDIFTNTGTTLAAQTWTKASEGNTTYAADGTTLTLTGTTFSITNAGVGATQLAAAVAGAGLTGGAGSALAVGAGDGITVAADAVSLASTAAGAGLTYTTGVLAVGAGTGISVAADAISLDTAVAVRKYGVDIGNGALTVFTITHNLGTRDVTWSCYDNATFEEYLPDVVHTTTNTLTATFSGVTPTTNQLRFAVQG